MYEIFKYVAFKCDPEFVHHHTVKLLSLLPSVFSLYRPIESSDKFQLQMKFGQMPFPVGIAAGLDKNAELIDYFGQIGIGALEVGTVTPRPQPGNERPRLFRLPKEKSLRNCMGFNGLGAEVVLSNIKNTMEYPTRLGINFGKNKLTPNDKAIEDYLELFHRFQGVGDYYVINVSSPNTPGLRDLQDESFLTDLSSEIKSKKISAPVYLKISPDMNEELLKKIVLVIEREIYAGIIATNTSNMPEYGIGGVSGALIQEKSKSIRNLILSLLPPETGKEVIGVGGVSSIEDLWDFWIHGGKFMQIYSSFIYQGPKIFTNFADTINFLMEYYGVNNVEELIRLVYFEKVKLPEKLI